MNIRKIVSLIFVIIPLVLFGQPEERVLLEINGHNITAAEFKRIYEKNNPDTASHSKDMEEYLDLFINFKLKVVEAENRGLDTTRKFQEELQHYRNELAKPYLVDDAAIDSMLREAYERKKQERNVSHILVNVSQTASPEDTALAYEKALRIRKRLKEGEEFSKVARETSDDPSARRNGGNIGFISAFKTVPAFEDAVYQMEVGEISQPVRTRFGYHIIRLNEVRKAPGKVKVAHIMLASPKNAGKAQQKKLKDSIESIYSQLQAGADFAELASKHSADRRSAKQGGKLPWFGSGKMVPEFEQAAFELDEIGEISQPIQTAFGWHIIKLLDKQSIKNFEDSKYDLKNKLKNTGRLSQARSIKVKELKSQYEFKQKTPLDEVYPLIDKAVLQGKWKVPAKPGLNKTLIAFGDTSFSVGNFLSFIADRQKKQKQKTLTTYVDETFKRFVNDKMLAYEKSKLEEKYPRFRYLMKEYHDGILLFEITDNEVWSKAVKDTLGIKGYYEKHKTDYMKPPEVDAAVFRYYDEDAFRKLRRYLRRKDRKDYSNEQIVSMLKEDGYKTEIFADTLFAKGDNQFVDAVWKDKPVDELDEVNKVPDKKVMVYIGKSHKARPKKISEARGIVTADYQDSLEKKWVEQLREKYSVTVHEDVLKALQNANE